MSQEQVLINAQALHRALAREDWVAVDCRSELTDATAGRRSYEQGHIPGAVFLDLDLDLAGPIRAHSGRHPLPDVDRICATLGELGIGNMHTIAVYDGGNGALAARAWWILRWLGHKTVRLLDGGYARWVTLELPVDGEVVKREPTAFLGTPDESLVLTTEELSTDITLIPGRHLLDAREPSRFMGEQEPIDPVAGHIPGAVNLPFAEFVTKEGTWRPLAERNALLEAVLGDNRETAWSVMCGSGVTACHLAISGLEAGFSDPQLYVGSWSEWIRDPSRPIEPSEG